MLHADVELSLRAAADQLHQAELSMVDVIAHLQELPDPAYEAALERIARITVARKAVERVLVEH